MQINKRNIKKRTYNEAFCVANIVPYKLKYFDSKVKGLYDLYFNFENVKLEHINIQEQYKYENLYKNKDKKNKDNNNDYYPNNN
jgi:hypothetical protein